MTLDNGPMTLSALFAKAVITVPPFQRAYAWDAEPHLRNFVQDLRNHPTGTGKRYFFGTILLTRSKEARNDLCFGYALVDGQQRLTTTCVFVAAAVERLRRDPAFTAMADKYAKRFLRDGSVRKFRTITEDDGFFERHVTGREAAGSCDTPSQRRLVEARQYFDRVLADIPAVEVDLMVKTLWDSQILVYAVDTDAEATQIFELQNDRGKRLTDLEALKSFLMHGLYLHSGAGADADLNVVQSNFAAIYRAAERIEGRVAAPDEDQLLSYHCIAFEEWRDLEDETDGWRRPKQLVRLLLADVELEGRADWIKEFSHRLKDTFSCALHVLDARDTNKSVAMGDLTALGRVAPFWPLALKVWMMDRGHGRPDFETCVRAMESFAFRATIAGKRSDTGDAELRRKARDFEGDFGALRSYLQDMRDWWNIPSAFANGLEAEDFYAEGRVATYLLWRYENHLRSLPGQQTPRLNWMTVAAPANAAVRYAKDHIEPKDPANPTLARMVKWAPQDVQERPFSEIYLHRLGNLVLDTVSTGSAKGNCGFADRIPHYQARSALLSQGEIVTRFAGKAADGSPVWDEASIRRRHDKLVDFAKTKM